MNVDAMVKVRKCACIIASTTCEIDRRGDDLTTRSMGGDTIGSLGRKLALILVRQHPTLKPCLHTQRSLSNFRFTRKNQPSSPISFSVRVAYFGGIWREGQCSLA